MPWLKDSIKLSHYFFPYFYIQGSSIRSKMPVLYLVPKSSYKSHVFRDSLYVKYPAKVWNFKCLLQIYSYLFNAILQEMETIDYEEWSWEKKLSDLKYKNLNKNGHSHVVLSEAGFYHKLERFYNRQSHFYLGYWLTLF